MNGQARYSLIPSAAVRDKDLTEIQFRCLCLIGTYLGEDTSAFPKQSTLAKDLDVSRETINRAIRVLKEKGYIEVADRHREDGSQTSSLYKVILDVAPKPCDPSITCDPSVTGGVTPKRITPGVTPRGSHQEHTQIKIPNEQTPARAPALELISENSSPEPDPVQQAVEYYNQVAPTVRWPQASKVTGKRAAALKARLKEFGLDAWKRVVDRAANTPWCCGQGGRKWFADIDYLSRESGFLKIYETLPQVSPQAKASPEDERRLNLERCFYQYGGGGAWRGREFGFPVRPDEPEAAGLYPDDLYTKYRVQRPQGAAA